MPRSETRTRDAERSRAAILDAAEGLFAERGFDGCSLAEIAEAAGVSRATPSYFFANKEGLHAAVLERVFADRDEAAARAFEPLVRWARSEDPEPLRRALTRAVAAYLDFLRSRPAFVRLLQHEELRGGARLPARGDGSTAMRDAFGALRRAGRRRGLRRFREDDAVLLVVSLVFSPQTQRSTFMAALGRDLDDPATRRRHVKLVVDQLLALVGPGRSG